MGRKKRQKRKDDTTSTTSLKDTCHNNNNKSNINKEGRGNYEKSKNHNEVLNSRSGSADDADADDLTSNNSPKPSSSIKFNINNCYKKLIESGIGQFTPSNWLNDIYTLSKVKNDNNTHSSTASMTSAASSASSVSDVTTIYTHDTNEDNKKNNKRNDKQNDNNQSSSLSSSSTHVYTKDDIHHLRNELNNIKYALWPTATKTSKVKNQCNRRKRKRNKIETNNQHGQEHGQEHGQSQSQSKSKSQSERIATTSPWIEFRNAREKCNPFENLGKQKWLHQKCIHDNNDAGAKNNTNTNVNTNHKRKKTSFVCRSAMKLANIDALLDFILTSTKDSSKDSTTEVSTTSTNKSSSSSLSSSSLSNEKILQNVHKPIQKLESFKFVDLCGAPGGFSEYILRRIGHCNNNCHCYGYGMSLIGMNDDGRGIKWDLKTLSNLTTDKCTTSTTSYATDNTTIDNATNNTADATNNTADANNTGDARIDDGTARIHTDTASVSNVTTDDITDTATYATTHTNPERHWKVCHGEDGTGDIYNWNNVIKLQNKIWDDSLPRRNGNTFAQEETSRRTNDEWKVNLVVADGGFDAQRDSECQESIAHQIVTCQTAAALYVLKKGGNFVIKMFGFQNSQKMILHLYNSFEKLVFLKPVTSRPASAERYVVCLHYNGLNPSFDVLSWRNDIVDNAEMTDEDVDHYVENYLNQIDYNMLQLNIQACSEIISSLHQEEENVKSAENMETNEATVIDFSYYRKYFQIGF